MRYIFGLFWLMVIVIGASFAILNPNSVVINYYVHTKSIHVPILLLFTLLIGAVLGIIGMLPAWFGSKCDTRRLRVYVKNIEQEVKNLRTMPIKDEH